jgi:hypothetical protein
MEAKEGLVRRLTLPVGSADRLTRFAPIVGTWNLKPGNESLGRHSTAVSSAVAGPGRSTAPQLE